MSTLFKGDTCVTVTTMGPGKLSLLSHNAISNIHSVVGAKITSNPGKTRWMIGFSHNYQGFAFIWEGHGEAVYRVGDSLLTHAVGTSWNRATAANWLETTVTTQDVSSIVRGLGSQYNRDNQTTFWIIPDSI